MISIITATDKKFLIGKKGKIPWNLPADFAYFKEKTLTKIVLMGSKTFFSLPEKNRPLPERKNFILTKNKNLNIENVNIIYNDGVNLEIFLEENKNKDIFVIGGGEVYNFFLEKKLVDKIYLTEVLGTFKGDVFFPSFFLKDFKEVSKVFKKKDEKNKYDMNFIIYEKK